VFFLQTCHMASHIRCVSVVSFILQSLQLPWLLSSSFSLQLVVQLLFPSTSLKPKYFHTSAFNAAGVWISDLAIDVKRKDLARLRVSVMCTPQTVRPLHFRASEFRLSRSVNITSYMYIYIYIYEICLFRKLILDICESIQNAMHLRIDFPPPLLSTS